MTAGSSATRYLFIIAFVLLLGIASGTQAVYKDDGESPQPYIIKGLVTVVFSPEAELESYNDGFKQANFALPTFDALLELHNVQSARKLFAWENERPDVGSKMPDYTRYWELQFSKDIPVADVIESLKGHPLVAKVEPVWALPLAASPDDPQFNSQWHMRNPNANVQGAWDIETGSDSIKVAIIDSGVNHNHSDLRWNIWVNPGEDVDGDGVVYDIDDLNGIDDDGNGVTDDLIGYDFFTGIDNPHPSEDQGTQDPDPNDFFGHGTACAGITSAVTNNGVNVTGMAGGWQEGNRHHRGTQIMCLRVGALDSLGNGYVNSNNCGTAIQYAARNGAHIINCSWGSSSTSTMISAMILVDSAGVTICHAAGNDNVNEPDYLDWNPAGVNVLSVASVTSSDSKSSYSNYGFWVDICAYGDNILSTSSNWYNPTTASSYGTSFASPMVCGLAAMVRSAMPSLTKTQVDSLIINTADDVLAQNPTYPGMLGAGRINAYAALSALANAKFTADVLEGEAPLTVNFTDLSPNSPTDWSWGFGDGEVSTDQHPTHVYDDPGIYDVSLVIDDVSTLGPGEEYKTDLIWVTADTLKMDSIEIMASGSAVMQVRLCNTSQISKIQLPLDFTNGDGVVFDSFSIAGTRTGYFDDVDYNAENGDKYSILFVPDPPNSSSHYLPVDTGVILNLHFHANTSANVGAVVAIDTTTLGSKVLKFWSIWGEYQPHVLPGKISINGCGRGDVNCDYEINIQDLVHLVGFMFQSGPPPDPWYTGDVDGSGSGPNIEDLVYLVTYMFQNGPPPPPL